MGKQITFYMDEKLEEEFFQFVKKDNLVLFTNENEELIYRSEEVNKLYQKLCRWIRKRIPKKEFMKNNYLCKEYISESLIPLAEKEGYYLY